MIASLLDAIDFISDINEPGLSRMIRSSFQSTQLTLAFTRPFTRRFPLNLKQILSYTSLVTCETISNKHVLVIR